VGRRARRPSRDRGQMDSARRFAEGEVVGGVVHGGRLPFAGLRVTRAAAFRNATPRRSKRWSG
jgi:hypothetical protein